MEDPMATDDKVHNAATDVADQTKAHLGQAAENVKDVFKG
jgi:hypothetical protein